MGTGTVFTYINDPADQFKAEGTPTVSGQLNTSMA